MATVPTFALSPSFLAIARQATDDSFCIAGVPFDIGTTNRGGARLFDLGTTNRSGARFGPAAIRQASRMLVDGDHPHWWIDPAAMSVADIGDFRIALGDIQGKPGPYRGASIGHRSPHHAWRRSHRDTSAAARRRQKARWTTRSGALRRPCRHLARQFRSALCPRLCFLPCYRGAAS